MKLSYNWLKDYVSHTLSPSELDEALTMSGLEVEGVDTVGATFEGIVVGHVLSSKQHPNADRLSCCQVDVGAEAPLSIVCGAPNVAAGQRVPVATVGTTLMLPDRDNPDEKVEVKIKKSKIRGEASQGMICAEDELGLSDDHGGIMVLDANAEIGQPFASYLSSKGRALQDSVLDISITPNRPDAISHIGVGRDVAALTGGTLHRPAVDLPLDGKRAANLIDVVIEAPDACRRYAGIVVKGVEVKASPDWLQQRLIAIGLRPRNNIVDITNYVMYECGQPLHAFDYDEVAGQQIMVRYSKKGEVFTTLDSKERKLPDNTLMICDAERAVAIAGVMGGENSEVTDKTTNVLIEAAYFDPSTIRRTAKLLGLQTDASYRFERGVDGDGQVWAAARAAQMMIELAGGTYEDFLDAHPNPLPVQTIEVRHPRIAKIIGQEIETATIVRFLTAIGFEIKQKGSGAALIYECIVPSFRPDVAREIDVIEEIARLYGYNNIPEPTHTTLPSLTPHVLPTDVLRRKARAMLVGLGFHETFTNSMLRKERAEDFNLAVLSGQEGEVVHTLKPISQEMAALRPSMLPGILSVMGHNQNHGQQALRFLEFGHIFHKGEAEGALVPGYAEHTSLLLAASGPREPVYWEANASATGFHDLRGIVESLLDLLTIPKVVMEPHYASTSVTQFHLSVKSRKQELGIIAMLSDEQRLAADLKTPVYFAELNWDRLLALATPRLRVKYQPISRFPVVERDLAVLIDQKQDVGPLITAMKQAGGALIQDISVFDIYQGDRISDDKKSIAFGLRFGANRTLKDKEVDKAVDAIIKALNQQYDAELRQ